MITAGATVLPGDFGLTQIGGEVGRLIRVGEWLNGEGFANYEHAFVYIGGGYVVEAEPGGARMRPATEYANIAWSSGHVQLTVCQRMDIVAAAKGYLGIPYSFLDYWALAVHRLGIPAPFLKKYVASSKHQICSQLVDNCYLAAGVHLFKDNRWPGYVTPASLCDLLQETA